MAWRLRKSVIRGEIDNRRQGVVVGRIWLSGRAEPLDLHLKGDSMPDLAGYRFFFTNPQPADGEAVDLAALQEGRVGEVTASRRVRLLGGADGREKLANALYIEWFSKANGRVVIESADFHVELGERGYQPDPRAAAPRAPAPGDDASLLDDDRRMNEFEWEQFMRESDKTAERFSKLFETYADHPDRDRIIAREMGWEWLEEALDEQKETEARGETEPAGGDAADAPPLVPNPLTEGTDWVRDDNGHVEHPVALRAHRIAVELWKDADAAGLMKDSGDPDLQEMVFQSQTTAAKLAGALNHLAYEDDPDAGFVVAALKRALNYLHAALAASGKLEQKGGPAYEVGRRYWERLFEIRQEILALMQSYRHRI